MVDLNDCHAQLVEQLEVKLKQFYATVNPGKDNVHGVAVHYVFLREELEAKLIANYGQGLGSTVSTANV